MANKYYKFDGTSGENFIFENARYHAITTIIIDEDKEDRLLKAFQSHNFSYEDITSTWESTQSPEAMREVGRNKYIKTTYNSGTGTLEEEVVWV